MVKLHMLNHVEPVGCKHVVIFNCKHLELSVFELKSFGLKDLVMKNSG